jgi:hypothetical protein
VFVLFHINQTSNKDRPAPIKKEQNLARIKERKKTFLLNGVVSPAFKGWRAILRRGVLSKPLKNNLRFKFSHGRVEQLMH